MKREIKNIENLHVLGNNEKCIIKGGKNGVNGDTGSSDERGQG